MRLLDLFCGAGGCSVGYARAGFEVVGVDRLPQPNYPYQFIQADALTFPLDGFDVVVASPPCQFYSIASAHIRDRFPDLIPPVRARLRAAGVPYLIENVERAPLRNPIRLCGTMFGLRVLRHRLFESNLPLVTPPHFRHTHRVKGEKYYVTVAGHGGHGSNRYDDWCAAMGIDWMTKAELAQAIPPAYTEFLGKQMMALLQHAA